MAAVATQISGEFHHGLLGCTGAAEHLSGPRLSTRIKRMQLTKLRAAPVLRAEVPPCAAAGQTDGGTAPQLIRGVRRTGRVTRE